MTNEEIIYHLNALILHFKANYEHQWNKKDIDVFECIVEKLSNSDEDKGEISDGYHTFNQLYHQRAVLFATIVNQNQDKAWKSYKHEDGQYCFDSNGEWFIVGIDTSEGSYTYHYSKEYWDLFKCKELPCGKHWDGHTEKDVTRLLSLEQEPCEDCISRKAVLNTLDSMDKALTEDRTVEEYKAVLEECYKVLPSIQPKPKTGHWILADEQNKEDVENDNYRFICSECQCSDIHAKGTKVPYCWNCGAKMESEDKE